MCRCRTQSSRTRTSCLYRIKTAHWPGLLRRRQ
ncbi:hypothetical protein L915_18196 [Phytophthora nicotianae]|uniref:Uncharacterized protein n=1 Tax=Phytophthora nicotianae TaxID=4792 RepID=W2I572_PHYNI|nr:hypothetical protein L915_18196 [Phytophthora nicotianae]ETL28582.1 hypothetical protein L916_18098 [Phytophthora nicotianae]